MSLGISENMYSDIIDHPHHISINHPQMAPEKRAAQFSPFAALTGYEDAVEEEARFVDEDLIFTEDRFLELDNTLSRIREQLAKGEHPFVSMICFREDEKKEGGSYQSVRGSLKKLDEYERKLILEDGESIALETVRQLYLSEGE